MYVRLERFFFYFTEIFYYTFNTTVFSTSNNTPNTPNEKEIHIKYIKFYTVMVVVKNKNKLNQ